MESSEHRAVVIDISYNRGILLIQWSLGQHEDKCRQKYKLKTVRFFLNIVIS